jgi:hypothetical protein
VISENSTKEPHRLIAREHRLACERSKRCTATFPNTTRRETEEGCGEYAEELAAEMLPRP